MSQIYFSYSYITAFTDFEKISKKWALYDINNSIQISLPKWSQVFGLQFLFRNDDFFHLRDIYMLSLIIYEYVTDFFPHCTADYIIYINFSQSIWIFQIKLHKRKNSDLYHIFLARWHQFIPICIYFFPSIMQKNSMDTLIWSTNSHQ